MLSKTALLIQPLLLLHQQITRQVFDHIWSQWNSDLQTILTGLPAGLAQPMQAQSLLLHYERWLILLKVRCLI